MSAAAKRSLFFAAVGMAGKAECYRLAGMYLKGAKA
jgi:hypothetical protein